MLFNAFNLVPVGDPGFEAVTVQEIKDHARIHQSADDNYLELVRIAAREQVEKDLNIAIVEQEYNWVLDHGFFHNAIFPPYGYQTGYGYSTSSYYYDFGFYSLNYFPRLRIPILPVRAINSVTYTDINGVVQTLDPSNYSVKLYKDPPEIWWTGQIPGIKPATDVVINLVAGYSTSDNNMGIASVTIIDGGGPYVDGIYIVPVSGAPGSGGTVRLIVLGGTVIDATVSAPGSGYTDQSDFTTSAFDLSGIPTVGESNSAQLKYFVSNDVVEQPANSVPQLIKMAIKILASTWYENREGTSDTLVRTIPLAYERIINLIQVKRFK